MAVRRSCVGLLLAVSISSKILIAADLNLAEVTRLYTTGCGLSAIRLVESSLDDRFAAKAPEERFVIYKVLLDICTEVGDAGCLNTYLPGFAETARELGRGSPLDPFEWDLHFFAILKLWAGVSSGVTPEWLLRNIADHAEPASVELYVESQIWAAQRELASENPGKARDRAEHALSLVLSLRRPVPYYVVKWLIEICSVLAGSGDLRRATQITVAMERYAERAIPEGSYLHLRYAELVGVLAERLGLFGVAETAFGRALELTAGVELPESLRTGYRDFFIVELAATQLAEGNIQRADEVLADYSRSPLLLNEDLSPDFRGDQDLGFAAALSLIRTRQGRALPKHWLSTLLQKGAAAVPAAGTAESTQVLHQQSLALGAAALIHLQENVPDADRELDQFIAKRLRIYQLHAERLPDVAALPNATDRVFLRLALDFLRRSRGISRNRAADLTLQVGQIVNRTVRDADGDALLLLANSDDEFSRRGAHALLRLSDRQSSDELGNLKALLDALMEGREPPGDRQFPIYDYSRRLRLAELGERLVYLREEVFRRSGSRPVSQVPTLSDLQAALRADEVLILFFRDAEFGIHVVVSRDDASVRVSKLDWGQILTDTRLLLLGLRAVHPASDSLDVQYPAQAAQRLYDVLLRPALEECTRRHLIWVPPEDLAALPITALLQEQPPALREGFDLSRAHFTVSDHDVSVVTSVKEFIASRRLAGRVPRVTSFFGAGQPSVWKESGAREGSNRGSPDSRSFSREMSRLPDIPDAGLELRDISRLFEPSAAAPAPVV